jgi:hypothetical protein
MELWTDRDLFPHNRVNFQMSQLTGQGYQWAPFLTHSQLATAGKSRSENTKAKVMRQSGKSRELH